MKLCAATITVLLVGLLEPCLSFPPAADAPFSNNPNSFGALYKGSHEGDAYTYSQTNTDSRGIGSAAYFGDLQGQGAMEADIQSYSTPTGSVSTTSTGNTLSARGGYISSISHASSKGLRK
uniref:Male reproductive-related protein A n=1 Tax=Macrobrachium rosenbergii TaxID=79674 RepID=B8LG29_MACRS|nr:male reproductive-related protein A [Macrobrachium rosenbergii]